ncbi:thrombospondin type 3 repeat-containing protein [Granulosicoccus antarcticus]|uniref:Uncharacterized protein n=1 Tax=Granulosicoccus antarcticus IMCC3135 TaxID=1192854 RepID=A0A2Z2NY01_9GAMM|nr:thrombospondin type 3 repeat-containing protein [Granulosicoccus antarcticus]ASJ74638.1 hypothetical protein IMCC3135_22840 [Granulosicoccus antarcticus IMCC3135]
MFGDPTHASFAKAHVVRIFLVKVVYLRSMLLVVLVSCICVPVLHAQEQDPCLGASFCDDFEGYDNGTDVTTSSADWSKDSFAMETLVLDQKTGGKALVKSGLGANVYFKRDRLVAFDLAKISKIELSFDMELLPPFYDFMGYVITFSDRYFLEGEEAQTSDLDLLVSVSKIGSFIEVDSRMEGRTYETREPVRVKASGFVHYKFSIDLNTGRTSLEVGGVLVHEYVNASLPTSGTYYHQPSFSLGGGEAGGPVALDNVRMRITNETPQYDLLSRFSDAAPTLAVYRLDVGEDIDFRTEPQIPSGEPWTLRFLNTNVASDYAISGVGPQELSVVQANYPIAGGIFTVGIEIGNEFWLHRGHFSATCPTGSNSQATNDDCDLDGLTNEMESPGRGVDGNSDGIYDFEPAAEGASLTIPTVFLEYNFQQDIKLLELEDRLSALEERGLRDNTVVFPRDFPRDMLLAVKLAYLKNGIQLIVDWDAADEIPAEIIESGMSGYDAAVDTDAGQVFANLFFGFANNSDIDNGNGNCLGTFGSAVERARADCEAFLGAKGEVYKLALFAENIDDNGRTGAALIGGPFLAFNLITGPRSISRLRRSQLSARQLVSSDAGTLMHELGHTLGLLHGGSNSIHCKPNYPSVMNYLYQTAYLSGDRPLRYSNGLAPVFDESNVIESMGFSFGGFPVIPLKYSEIAGTFLMGERNYSPDFGVDWDGDGISRDGYPMDYNYWIGALCAPSNILRKDTLKDHDDWSFIKNRLAQDVDSSNKYVLERGLEHNELLSTIAGSDVDGDGVIYELDNCAIDSNPEQLDSDGDGFGDACDSCAAFSDSAQADLDLDGLNDVCDPAPLAPSLIVPSNSWVQISLPADVYGSTVAEVFGSVLDTSTYNNTWVLFDYLTEAEKYTIVPLGSVLSEGKGYWFTQLTGSDVELQLPPSLSVPEVIESAACGDQNDCVLTDNLFTSKPTSGTQWAMIGNPFIDFIKVDNIDFVYELEGQWQERSLVDGGTDGLTSEVVFSYDESISDYRQYGTGESLPPWVGGWVGFKPTVNPSVTNVGARF